MGNFFSALVRWLRVHDGVREILSVVFIVGIVYFGARGSLILLFRNPSPMMAVSGRSMTHNGDVFDDYFENNGDYPFSGGLEEGELVFVRGVSSIDELERGDVIVWQREGAPVIHRVDIIEEDYVRTRGDRHGNIDPIVRLENIIGRAVFSIPYLGYPSLW